jgi:hypothetical protein
MDRESHFMQLMGKDIDFHHRFFCGIKAILFLSERKGE